MKLYFKIIIFELFHNFATGSSNLIGLPVQVCSLTKTLLWNTVFRETFINVSSFDLQTFPEFIILKKCSSLLPIITFIFLF